MAGQILIFDSGIGGISVVREIKQLLPQVSIDYLFDNLYYPYGRLSEEQLIKRLVELMSDVVNKTKPQLLVIACNSASTIALPALRKALSIPVVGVVPAIKPAAQQSKNKVIGLLATQGTISRDYISRLSNEHAPDCHLIKVGTNELVAMAESVFRNHAINLDQLTVICKPLQNTVDTLVLGCTHFPLLKNQLQQVLPQNVTLIDSGAAIAQRVCSILIKKPDNNICFRAFYTERYQDDSLNQSLAQEGFSELVYITR
ncbi:MAG: glutamate racemase [Gammaproteobacteria bacterium]|nr:glutamate racemase [Gammaproteobacteria bacterium]